MVEKQNKYNDKKRGIIVLYKNTDQVWKKIMFFCIEQSGKSEMACKVP